MAKWDDAKTHNQIKAYPRGSAQGGRAIQAVKGGMSDNDGTSGHRTIMRETSEGRATARTRDEMPMVEVEKQACEIGVDHGIIDMHAVGPLHPDAYKDGDLYFTPFVASHIAAATPDDPDRPIVDEIEPPDSVKGEAPTDGDVAKSLRSGRNADNRDAVYAKKLMMGQCPASIFTGRTRLWVQALYGRHDALNIVSLYLSLLSATPSLKIAEDDAFDVLITTSTGVYLDPVTAKHWMISVVYDKVTFYPMETSEDCIDELRTFLLDPLFPAEDKERVETYILADSKPAISKRQEVTIPATSSYSMGYGWHFNWTGDRCDIVLNGVTPYHEGGEHNVSIHYRLTFSMSATGVWSAARSTVEGPTHWKSLRHVHPIVEPEWSEFILTKFGAHHGPSPYGNAPFYAFYDRDELKVARYAANTTSNTKQGVTREPAYYNPGTYITIGTDALDYRTRDAWTGSTTTFTCGSVSINYATGSYKENAITRSSPNSSDVRQQFRFGPSPLYMSGMVDWPVGPPGSVPLATIGDEYWGTISAYSGAPVSGWSTQSFGPFAGDVRGDDGILYCRAETEQFEATETLSTQFIAVIPFGDSEAVYLYGQQDRSTREVGVAQTDSADWFGYRGVWENDSIDAIHHRAAAPGGDFYFPENVQPFDRTNTSSSSIGKLVSSAGVFDATFPGKSGFWSANDTVPQQYFTVSSASGNAVRSHDTGVSSGNPATTDANIYVGWA